MIDSKCSGQIKKTTFELMGGIIVMITEKKSLQSYLPKKLV